jgi:CMP-N-acetylneuraminic acid synthetase
MVVHTIRAALESGCFESVYVSTEAPDIAEIAAGAGAVVHPRPDELAGDLVSATDVCLEVEESLRGDGLSPDAVVCLQPSSPLREAADVRKAWQHFVASEADYLVSVTPIDPHYFHWALREMVDGSWRMWFGDEFLMERPLLPPVQRPNGAIKIGRVEPLRRTRNFFGERLTVTEMDESSSIHVATQFDYEVAEYLLHQRLRLRRASV